MKHRIILALTVLLFVNSYAIEGIKVELQFFTQTYRLNQPIEVMVNVVNASSKEFRFDVSSLIYETFYFEVKTPQNEDIKVNDEIEIEMKTHFSSVEDYRTIILKPGEAFARTIDINQWFDIRESGYYFIKGKFFPNPDDKREWVESIYYKILVKPPQEIEAQISKQELEHLKTLEEVKYLPPYEVISDMLDAKMKKDWERFLIHIDAERLIQSFPNYASQYENARTGQYRLEVLEDFKRYLTVYWQDIILSYSVNKSIIENDRATVVCDVRYQIRNVSYTLRYTFLLYLNHDMQWLVYDYTVLTIK